jgi:hypothetical protein
MQCIGEAFGVDASDDTQQKLYSTKPANLLSIFDVYLKTKSSATAAKVRKTTWMLTMMMNRSSMIDLAPILTRFSFCSCVYSHLLLLKVSFERNFLL